jgi:hypothetical protein
MTDMTNSLVATIERSSERAWLRRCGEHNASLGKKIVADAAARRLRDLDLHDALRARPEAHSVEERVGESLRVYRELLKHKHGRSQAAGYTEREIRQYGPRDALIRTIRRAKKTDGLRLLAANDRLDCAYEQIAIDHADEIHSRAGAADDGRISKHLTPIPLTRLSGVSLPTL